jgi:hypothetical protein
MSSTRSFSAQSHRATQPCVRQASETNDAYQSNRSPRAARSEAIHPDVELARRVSAFLRDRGVASAQALDIEARQGTVHIAGRVRTYYEKQLVYHTASRVAGVLQVTTDLQVVEPADSEPVEQGGPQLGWRDWLPTSKLAFALGAWLIVAGIAIVGRGIGGEPAGVKQAFLSGRLLFRGVPAAGDYVSLHALGATLEPQPLSARVGKDGSFRISCQTSHELPRGFVATVHHASPTDRQGWRRIPSEYARPETSPLRIRLTAGTERSVTFHIL